VDTKHFGRLVRNRRKSRRWTIEHTAELCGICNRCLEQIELGDSNPKLSNVLKLALVLEMDLGDLNICVEKKQ